MRVLLDTHVVLWWLADDSRLGERARDLIGRGSNEVLVSALSGAEIAVKSSVGKLRAPEDFEDQLVLNSFSELPLSMRHGVSVATLPLHHRDPFDRLLIAQARCEDLPIVTADPVFARYDVRVIEA